MQLTVWQQNSYRTHDIRSFVIQRVFQLKQARPACHFIIKEEQVTTDNTVPLTTL